MNTSKLQHFWPDWQLKEILGEGAYGKVYRAEKIDPMVHSEAAIKVISVPQSQAELAGLRSEGMDETATKTYFHGIVEDFVNEIKLMENLKGVTNIVSVEDYKVIPQDSGIGWDIFIRMELLTPFSVRADKGLSESDIIKLGVDICTALEVCSKMNIIHRDIKPANIFISKMGDYKLGDFGIAKKLEATSSAMSAKGTQSYVAPEVLRGGKYDSTVDIYSLGLVMYRLLNNNRPPFIAPDSGIISYRERQDANDRRLAGDALPPPCNASKELATLILAACSFNPSRRFKTPTAFKNALLAYSAGLGQIRNNPPPHDDTDNPNTPPNNKKKTGIIIALVILLILMAGAAVFIFGNELFSKDENNTVPDEPVTAEATDTLGNTDTDITVIEKNEPESVPFTEETADGIWYTNVTTEQFEKLTGSSVSGNLSRLTGTEAEADISDYPDMTFIFEFFDDEKKSICYFSPDSLEAYLIRYNEDVTSYLRDPEVLAHIQGITLDELNIAIELEGLTTEEYTDRFVADYISDFDAHSMARELSNQYKKDSFTYEVHENGLTVYADTAIEMSYENAMLCCIRNGVEMLLNKDTENNYERSILTAPQYNQLMGYWYAPIDYTSVLELSNYDPSKFIAFSLSELGLGSYSWPEAEIYCDGDSHAEIRINGYDLNIAKLTYLAAYYERLSIPEVAVNSMHLTEDELNSKANQQGYANWNEYMSSIVAACRTDIATLEETNTPDIVYDGYFYRTTNSDVMYMTDSEYTESFRYDMGDLNLIYSNASSRLSELCGQSATFKFYSKDTPKY